MENAATKPTRGRRKSTLLKAVKDNFNEPSEIKETFNEFPEPTPVRQSARPDLREESPLARAARRAAEIQGHIGEFDGGTDDFYIDPKIIPEGWSYEWKRKTIAGQEDPSYQLSLLSTGWEPVPASRHRQLMPEGHYNTIERKGMILMERPQVITDKYKAIEAKKARDAVRQKEAQIDSAKGLLGREDSRVRPKISKGYEPMMIPDE
jgi:hypothetical protein